MTLHAKSESCFANTDLIAIFQTLRLNSAVIYKSPAAAPLVLNKPGTLRATDANMYAGNLRVINGIMILAASSYVKIGII